MRSFTACALTTSVSIALAAALTLSSVALADGKGPAVSNEDGKYFDKDGTATYNVKADGTVDWYTYSGFRRYHSECHVCHGPDGMGSSYAPALTKSLQIMDYGEYLDVVVNGRKVMQQGKPSVMPSFGDNKNVMCFIDDIFIYLKARSDDAVARGRPRKREDKPKDAREYEKSCFSGD